MTGYQGRSSGGPKNPYYIRRDGHLIAFTVRLAKPTPEEVKFFQDNFGTPSTARISVLRRGTTKKTRLDHRLINQSDTFELDRYFGSNADVRVRQADPGQEGQLDRDHGAHLGAAPVHEPGAYELVALVACEGRCEPPKSLRQFAMEDLRQVNQFGCTYHGARLLYSVTYVPSNHVDEPGELKPQKGLQPAATSR